MGPFSRRDALRGGRDLAALLSLSTLAGVESPFVTPADAAQDARRAAPDVYRSIGVKPIVNARGTFTIISGSLMLPEVRAAMDAAARCCRPKILSVDRPCTVSAKRAANRWASSRSWP